MLKQIVIACDLIHATCSDKATMDAASQARDKANNFIRFFSFPQLPISMRQLSLEKLYPLLEALVAACSASTMHDEESFRARCAAAFNADPAYQQETAKIANEEGGLQLGREIIALTGSAFLPSIWKKLKLSETKQKELKKTEVDSVSELKESADELLASLGAEAKSDLSVGTRMSWRENKLFRLDVGGSSIKGWTVDLQDNVGRDMHVNKNNPNHPNEPVSSKFAVARVIAGISWVPGKRLMLALHQSMNSGKDVLCSNSRPITPDPAGAAAAASPSSSSAPAPKPSKAKGKR